MDAEDKYPGTIDRIENSKSPRPSRGPLENTDDIPKTAEQARREDLDREDNSWLNTFGKVSQLMERVDFRNL